MPFTHCHFGPRLGLWPHEGCMIKQFDNLCDVQCCDLPEVVEPQLQRHREQPAPLQAVCPGGGECGPRYRDILGVRLSISHFPIQLHLSDQKVILLLILYQPGFKNFLHLKLRGRRRRSQSLVH